MRALLVLFVLATVAWPQTFREKRPGKAHADGIRGFLALNAKFKLP